MALSAEDSQCTMHAYMHTLLNLFHTGPTMLHHLLLLKSTIARLLILKYTNALPYFGKLTQQTFATLTLVSRFKDAKK
jgi:hypothetical protein